MIKKLLFILCIGLSLSLSAQVETITIDWSFNSIPGASGDANSSRTIEVGDTVQWNWYANGSHNVVSSSGSSESFSSGATTSNQGINFFHKFTKEGSNPYVCQPHSNTMFGTITVVADGTLGVTTFEDALSSINIYPNPASSTLNIDFAKKSGDLKLEVFDVLGRQVYDIVLSDNESSINVTNLISGVYLVRVSDDNTTQTKRFIKK